MGFALIPLAVIGLRLSVWMRTGGLTLNGVRTHYARSRIDEEGGQEFRGASDSLFQTYFVIQLLGGIFLMK